MQTGRILSGYWLGSVVVLACVLAVAGCSAGASRVVTPVVHVSGERVLLLPAEAAGEAGWCMTTESTGACGYASVHPPIVGESWSSSSSSGEGSSEEVQGFGLTSGEVTHVVVKGQTIPTRAESELPDGLRAVAVEFRGKGPGNGERFPRFRPVNSSGQIIPARRGPPLIVRTEPTRFSDANHPAVGACRIKVEPFGGLVVGGGSVVARVRVYAGLLGQAFQVCASSSYAINGLHLGVAVLLSAAHPGDAPAMLPAALPLPGHQGVFYEPGVEGGETLARRVAGAWIVVSKGKDQRERLTLLEHVRVTMHA
jgi:hypothetical protein